MAPPRPVTAPVSRRVVYEKAGGWIFWTWKTEGAPEWDMQDLLANGLFPSPVGDMSKRKCEFHFVFSRQPVFERADADSSLQTPVFVAKQCNSSTDRPWSLAHCATQATPLSIASPSACISSSTLPTNIRFS
jgi:hypothetical protein